MVRIAHNSDYKTGLQYQGQNFAGPYDLFQSIEPRPKVSIQTFLTRLRRFQSTGKLTDSQISEALNTPVEKFKKTYSSRKTIVYIGEEPIDLSTYHGAERHSECVNYRNFWQRVRRLKLAKLLTADSLRDALTYKESDWITFYGGGRHREFVHDGEAYPEYFGRLFRSVAAFLKVLDRYDERSTVWSRMKNGSDLDLALTIPVDHQTERKGTVYKLVRKKTGQIYIGITLSSADQRWAIHLARSRSGTTKLAHAIHADGGAGFLLEILEEGIDSPELLKKRESFWVDEFGALGPKGLNTAKPGALSTKPGKTVVVEGKQFRSHKEASEVIGVQKGLAPHVVLRRLAKGLPLPAKARKHSKHPEAGTNLFRRWLGLLKRHSDMVVDSWKQSYDDFKNDIGFKSDLNLELVRVDDSKPWGPDNFQWLTTQQKIEKVHGLGVAVDGVTFPSLKALAKHYGIGVSTLKDRIGRQGMSLEEAVSKGLSPTSYRNFAGKVSIDGRNFMSKRQAILYVQETRGLTEHKAKVWVNKLLAGLLLNEPGTSVAEPRTD